MRYCVLAVCVLLLSGCLMENMAPERRLRDAVEKVNDGMRWSQTDVALPHVEEGYRAKFMRMRYDWGRVIRIADTEIVSMKVSEESPDDATALVIVRWYSRSDMRLFETRIEQKWKHGARGKGYQLIHEEVVGGNAELLAGAETETSGGESATAEAPTGGPA